MTCKTCGSKRPHLHPAVQFEGEVELCVDEFHMQQTPQNRPGYVAAALAKARAMSGGTAALTANIVTQIREQEGLT